MSLLRRIEQGQNGSQPEGGAAPAAPQPAGGAGQSGGGESSRLSSLQARRVSAPTTSPKPPAFATG